MEIWKAENKRRVAMVKEKKRGLPVPRGRRAQGGLSHVRRGCMSVMEDSTQPKVPSPPPINTLNLFTLRKANNLQYKVQRSHHST